MSDGYFSTDPLLRYYQLPERMENMRDFLTKPE